MRRPQGMTLAEAFAWHPKGTAQPLVAGIKGECITWNAARVGSGYGQFRFEGRHVTAHVVAYSLANGPVPTGMMVDHRCFRRECVNPTHLRAVTPKQNTEHLRGAYSNNACGVRGVRKRHDCDRWQVRVAGRHVGTFSTLAEAEQAAIAARAEQFTHDDCEAS